MSLQSEKQENRYLTWYIPVTCLHCRHSCVSTEERFDTHGNRNALIPTLRLSLSQAPQTKILHYTPTPNLSILHSPLSNSSERGSEPWSRRTTNRSVGVYMVGEEERTGEC